MSAGRRCLGVGGARRSLSLCGWRPASWAASQKTWATAVHLQRIQLRDRRNGRKTCPHKVRSVSRARNGMRKRCGRAVRTRSVHRSKMEDSGPPTSQAQPWSWCVYAVPCVAWASRYPTRRKHLHPLTRDHATGPESRMTRQNQILRRGSSHASGTARGMPATRTLDQQAPAAAVSTKHHT